MYYWINSEEALSGMVADIGAGPVAIDLEADSMHHYKDKVCLIQVSFGGRDSLIDPLDGADPRILATVLADRRITKIFHGADYDMRMLYRDFGLSIAGLFDTMIAARMIGERSFGLAALLDKYLKVKLDKQYQKEDWSRRPLPTEMQTYAVEDTRHLERLAGILQSRMADLGRQEWAEEEFRILELVRWNDTEENAEAYLKVKGASSLDSRGLTVLRELFTTREVLAKDRDLPPFRILPDRVLVDLAAKKPVTIAGLKKLKGLPKAYMQGPRAELILESVDRGMHADVVSRPRKRNTRRRSGSECSKELRVLMKNRDKMAENLSLEPSFLASRKLMEGIVEKYKVGQEWGDLPGLRMWQRRILAEILDRM